MNCQKINFCNLNGYFIKNQRTKSDILNEIINTYNYSLQSFDKSYSDNILDFILKPDTLSCFITGGVKYYLYLTNIYNEDYSIFIKNENSNLVDIKMISIPLSFQKDLYNNNYYITVKELATS